MKLKPHMAFGCGDALLTHPGLLDDYDPSLPPPQPYVAVHLHASLSIKQPPMPDLLRNGLLGAGVEYVEVGDEVQELPPILSLHIDVVKRARKFIGTMSVFNVVAQIKEIPSFVLINRSIHDALIFEYMTRNRSIVRAWNDGRHPIEDIYREAVEWAKM